MGYVTHTKARFEPLRSVECLWVKDTYAPVGNPIQAPASALFIHSTLDKDTFLSLDGISDHVFVGADAFISFAFGSFEPGPHGLALPKGSKMFLKAGTGGLPSSGSLHLMVVYGER